MRSPNSICRGVLAAPVILPKLAALVRDTLLGVLNTTWFRTLVAKRGGKLRKERVIIHAYVANSDE
jgi:hypothetical protein